MMMEGAEENEANEVTEANEAKMAGEVITTNPRRVSCSPNRLMRQPTCRRLNGAPYYTCQGGRGAPGRRPRLYGAVLLRPLSLNPCRCRMTFHRDSHSPVTRETAMGSFQRENVFDPLDLEIIERVYEAIWAQIVARQPDRDTVKDAERQKALKRWLFALAGPRPVDFDTLYDRVLASIPKTWGWGKPVIKSETLGEPRSAQAN